jgi:hypothetical protein
MGGEAIDRCTPAIGASQPVSENWNGKLLKSINIIQIIGPGSSEKRAGVCNIGGGRKRRIGLQAPGSGLFFK